MRKWAIVLLFTLALSAAVSLQTITLKLQEVGIYTQDRVVYTLVASEVYGISASDYVFPVVINTSFPAFDFFRKHSIYAASDPDCEYPIKYWVQYTGKTDVFIWIHVSTMPASGTTTFYVCASTTNPDPASGDPEINHMFLLFDNFDGHGYISWTPAGPGMMPSTITPITHVSNGTLTMIFDGGPLTEAGLAAGSINVANTPYFIVLAKISAAGPIGALGGIYVNMSRRWVSLYVGNVYVTFTDTAYNGFYMFFSSSDYFGDTYTYPQYQSTGLNNWVVLAEWNFFGNYPAVYPVLYDTYMNAIASTSASLYYTAPNPRVGLFQLRWNDGLTSNVEDTMYVDWFAVIQYWGFPSLSYLGASVHETVRG